jgi:hypothetical protein
LDDIQGTSKIQGNTPRIYNSQKAPAGNVKNHNNYERERQTSILVPG